MKSIVLLSILVGACYATPFPLRRIGRGDCPEFCPHIFGPFCASNGTHLLTFPNHCQMTVYNCKQKADFHALRSGPCEEDASMTFGVLSAAAAIGDLKPPQDQKTGEVIRRKIVLPSPPRGNCPTMCPQIFAPVCGSDRFESRTFGNKCEMNAFNCWESRNFLALRSGPCDDGALGFGGLAALPPQKVALERKRPCKPCTRIYLPVCGFDGKEQKVFGNPCMMEFFNCMESRHFSLLRHGEC